MEYKTVSLHVECLIPKEPGGILHPDTSFVQYCYGISIGNWYQDVKYPLIPEEPGGTLRDSPLWDSPLPDMVW